MSSHMCRKRNKTFERPIFPRCVRKFGDELEVHVIVGVNEYQRIVTKTSKWGEIQSEPIAIETISGWTLAGEIKDENVRNTKANVNLAINSKKWQSQFHKLWDYESIGTIEETDPHAIFKAAVNCTGERYRVKIPWKEGDYDIPNNKEFAEQRLNI